MPVNEILIQMSQMRKVQHDIAGVPEVVAAVEQMSVAQGFADPSQAAPYARALIEIAKTADPGDPGAACEWCRAKIHERQTSELYAMQMGLVRTWSHRTVRSALVQ